MYLGIDSGFGMHYALVKSRYSLKMRDAFLLSKGADDFANLNEMAARSW